MSLVDSRATYSSTDDSAKSAQQSAPARTTVLIVDDSPVDRRLASAIVDRRKGYHAITAADGHEALERIDRDSPTIVVTDLQMAGMNGLELVEEIRKLHPGIPVLLMTAYGSEDIAMQALRAGAANYVPKKALAKDLVDTLDAIVMLAAVDHRRQKLLRCMESSRSSFVLENDPELIAPLIAMLQEDLDGVGFCDSNQRTRVGVALQESLANALYHGNLEVSSELRQEDERRFYAEAEVRRSAIPYRHRRISPASPDLDRR